MTEFTYNGTKQEINFANSNKAFTDWKTKIGELLEKPGYKSDRIIHIRNVFAFGDIRYTPKGFVFASIDITKDGKTVPGCVFLRGDSVACIVILVNKLTNNKFVLTVRQPRIAIGHDDEEEIVAGMLDASNNFVGVAAKEILEETSINISDYGLEELSSYAVPMSQGACDERIKFYAVEIPLNEFEIAALDCKYTGNIDEGECIKLKVRTYDDFKSAIARGEIRDAKSIIAASLYDKKIKDYNENVVANTRKDKMVNYLKILNIYWSWILGFEMLFLGTMIYLLK